MAEAATDKDAQSALRRRGRQGQPAVKRPAYKRFAQKPPKGDWETTVALLRRHEQPVQPPKRSGL